MPPVCASDDQGVPFVWDPPLISGLSIRSARLRVRGLTCDQGGAFGVSVGVVSTTGLKGERGTPRSGGVMVRAVRSSPVDTVAPSRDVRATP